MLVKLVPLCCICTTSFFVLMSIRLPGPANEEGMHENVVNNKIVGKGELSLNRMQTSVGIVLTGSTVKIIVAILVRVLVLIVGAILAGW